MRSPLNECIMQQGNSVPQVTLQSSSQNQSQYSIDGLSVSSDQSTLKLTANESPSSSPKHSPRQTHKKENSRVENSTRDPSPLQLEKSDPEQQDAISRSSDSIQPPELNRSVSHDSNNKDRKESRGSDRSKKKSSWYSVFYFTYKSRSEELKRYFKDVPVEERLIVDYSCALQREILHQGRLYVTQNYLCFYGNIFRWETRICIKWKDVSAVTKRKTVKLIPNAIVISTESEKLFFTTFSTRDKAFMTLFRVWQNALLDQPMSMQELWKWIHTVYGDELGLTSDDEDYKYIPPNTGFDDKIYPIERLSADSLSEQQVYGGGGAEKGGSELGSSATDSTNKSQGSMPSQNTFLADSTPSPLQMGVDTIPTDISDNSSESDMNPSGGEKIITSCSSPHEGRHLCRVILPMHVDQLFTVMFTNSKFFFEFHAMRQSSDIRASSWQQSPESKEKIRTITMTVSVGQSFGVKTSNVQQTQIMLQCSVPGQLYSIDDEIVNSGIPYADSFYIIMHYCLEKASDNETNLNIYGQLKYKKSVWGFVKNLIEKTTWSNMKEHNDSLVKALLAECDETIPKGRKGRRRHRAISNKPVLLPVDHLPSTRGPTFNRVTNINDTDRRSNVLLGVVLAILIFLVFLNGLLYYKLWLMEDFTQVSKFNFWQAEVEILKDPPKNHKEWLKVLRLQENIHRMEVDKWQKVLQSTVDLLKKAEEALNGLQGTLKSPYEEVLLEKDKQEL